jgi:hypothetical protein
MKAKYINSNSSQFYSDMIAFVPVVKFTYLYSRSHVLDDAPLLSLPPNPNPPLY